MPILSPLDMKNIVPLVTGGGSGIGFALVEEFLKRGSPKALITGRRLDVLQAAAERHPGQVFYKVSDAGSATDRVKLFDWITTEHADCNALVNNAGIQRRFPLVNDSAPWEERAAEIEINVAGPIHLSTMFIPHLLNKPVDQPALIANVTGGLAFIPMVAGPVYSATKAAIHNYTMSLRWSLSDTHVRVVELVPPAVKSNLGGGHGFGEDMDEYIVATMDRVDAGEVEVGYKYSDMARLTDRAGSEAMMEQIATMGQTPKYAATRTSI